VGQDDVLSIWDRLGRSAIPRRPTSPPVGHSHLDEDELWTLSGYDGGPMAETERLVWQRALECSECYNRLGSLRQMVQHPEGDAHPNLPISLEELLRARRGQATRVQIAITQEWLAAMLAAASSSRIRIRGAVRTRGGPPRTRVPAPGESRLVVETADLIVTVIAEPSASRFNLLVRATPKTGDASTEGLIARLHKPDKGTIEQPFEGKAEVSFSGLKLDSYELELLPST
jgi:hypothetical protein